MQEEESGTAKGDAEEGNATSVIAAFQAEEDDDELQESLRKGNEVRKDMRAVRSQIDEMAALQQNIIDEIQRDKQRSLTSELDELVDKSSFIVQRIADTLKSMDEENKAFVEKNGVTTVSRIRENQTMSLLREYRELVERYQKIQRDHQQVCLSLI
jgi:t-SNARE complex subunit (syntaxin)